MVAADVLLLYLSNSMCRDGQKTMVLTGRVTVHLHGLMQTDYRSGPWDCKHEEQEAFSVCSYLYSQGLELVLGTNCLLGKGLRS